MSYSEHQNIGATVSMLRLIDGLGGSEKQSNKLAKSLAALFMAESNMCSFKNPTADLCNYRDLNSKIPCCIGECPLGELLDKEI